MTIIVIAALAAGAFGIEPSAQIEAVSCTK